MTMKVGRIAVGVDGSANSLAAVEVAAGIAAAFGAEVVAVHALGLLERMAPDAEPVPTAGHRDEIRARFESQWCAALDEAGVTCNRIIRDGPPVQVMLDVADEEGVDVIVLGSRGLGGFPEALLGSTSTQVAQHAKVPVVIVPHVDG
jgi:nucleotide-binding universal stress UspA family protein